MPETNEATARDTRVCQCRHAAWRHDLDAGTCQVCSRECAFVERAPAPVKPARDEIVATSVDMPDGDSILGE